jgi:CheY-like chemotaxis protein
MSVTDTGTGMTPETIARIFDPFYTTKPLGQGTGLGLSMIYGFAEQSGGRVEVRSSLGRGTTMSLYLPRDFQPEPFIEAPSAIRDDGSLHRTILVVDDEETIRTLVVEVLQGLGHTVIAVDSAASALEVLRSTAHIDLLITDVGLPGGMNGRQVADIGRVVRVGLKVLFITGYAGSAMIGNAQLPPGMHVLTKPFRLSELASRINNLMLGHADRVEAPAPVLNSAAAGEHGTACRTG